MSNDNTWAPARIYLQREQGELGSHTWCEDSVGDDMTEEVAYVRADVAALASDAAGGPVAWAVYNGVCRIAFYMSEEGARDHAQAAQRSHDLSGSLAAFTVKPLYAAPVAPAAPEGWKIVPMTPTKAMLAAGVDAAVACENKRPWCPSLWDAMLAAAPTPVAADAAAQPCGVCEGDCGAEASGYACAAQPDERAAFEWPPLPTLPNPSFCDFDRPLFTEHQMQGYANAYGETVRAAAQGESNE